MSHAMNIGEAAIASGVSAKMIRYYETIGVVPHAARSGGNYRVYEASDVHTLRFVRRARNLGFSIEEIERLLSLWRDSSRASADVKVIARRHIADLEKKISALDQMVRTLKHLVASCAGDQRAHCPILMDLAGEEAEHHARRGADARRKHEIP